MSSLASKISNAYPTFNKTSALIADAYFKNPSIFLSKNIKELGDITKTSGASVIRFCKNLGFKGFKDFQIACAQEQPLQVDNKIETIITENDNPTSVLFKLQTNLSKNIVDLGRSIDHKELKQAVELIDKARVVFIAGEGASGLAAEDFFDKLIRSGKEAIFIKSSHISLEGITNITKNDVLVIFSYSGMTQEPLLMAKQARKNHAKIVLITREKTSPLRQISDIVISLPTNEKLLRFGAVNSLFSEMFASSLLYLSLISPKLNKLKEKMEITQELTDYLKIKD
ncbi:MurR/RpiR family transcriptional regulator [Lactobacillus delbrueckii subsp. lactis]|uniref:MurR/RpiR family transcriptional regulator n=1 Tax=Lactobacillus delbrueckii TaxID=1584 RepID=UPI001F25ABAB|nr:MurR/RpiR family transcriptional regulator [Lactobacillus delbrueckii]MDQ7161458.1 MurR/RpiR family transcriptional regulator [Lactobacillus delbrueckii subsp. lactis]MDQ7163232.1 MurR/RpiR family transcriptional regulator [Lactobacillus delbrueckii subsp. lactis]MDQ7177077.1 MurR/RpiR family transcriptional regulator [Lactobacillus delbrueckii subsp. lactis]MDQ7205514.1 MurR/RpiR family transcriptional regulator [Lactobacillus delbrueckii subsp. lactis]GHN25075.1 RpiR family transcriptiona